MSTQVFNPRLSWNAGDPDIAVALQAEIDKWLETPYESGQSFPKRGADCTGSVFGIVDALDGRARMAPAGFPHDASMHDRVGAIKAMREILVRYQPHHKIELDENRLFQVEPGDILITGMPGGGPGHCEIVGPRPNELWHALPSAGFHQSGWSLLDIQVLYAIYRIEDKHRWTS